MIVHVYPETDVEPHVTEPGGCWCEPAVEDYGMDADGLPARVMVHQKILEHRGTHGKGHWVRGFRTGWLSFGDADRLKKFWPPRWF